MKATLLITVDNYMQADIKLDDPHNLGLAMLGGLELAKHVVLEKLMTSQVTKSGNMQQEQQEESVTKDEALGILLKTRKRIEARIDAINRSDDQAVFTIDSSLFDKI